MRSVPRDATVPAMSTLDILPAQRPQPALGVAPPARSPFQVVASGLVDDPGLVGRVGVFGSVAALTKVLTGNLASVYGPLTVRPLVTRTGRRVHLELGGVTRLRTLWIGVTACSHRYAPDAVRAGRLFADGPAAPAVLCRACCAGLARSLPSGSGLADLSAWLDASGSAAAPVPSGGPLPSAG